ncbi:MAG: oxidoreductase [Flavobacteriaceae bacterium]|nr:oxidoreductase [Flavobacteriaceae bacterium]
MKKFAYPITLNLLMLTFIITVSCDTPRYFEGVRVTPLLEDEISIRAVEVVHDKEVWFAANKGRIGVYNGQEVSQIVLHHNDSLLHFRSIAHNGTHAFALTIDRPALLYRLSFDGHQIVSADLVYTEDTPGVFYDAIDFWNPNEGIAVGDPTDGCLSVLITRDAGTTWEKLPCHQLPPSIEGEALFAASNGSIAVQGDQALIGTGGAAARVFKTTDKGKTWSVAQTPITQGSAMQGIFSIASYDENTAVIYGGDWANPENNRDNKARSKDAGRSWQLLSPGAGPGYRSCVRFVPGTHGRTLVAAGSKGISASYDRGKTWNQLSDISLYTLRFVNDSVAYAGGAGKFLRLTFD